VEDKSRIRLINDKSVESDNPDEINKKIQKMNEQISKLNSEKSSFEPKLIDENHINSLIASYNTIVNQHKLNEVEKKKIDERLKYHNKEISTKEKELHKKENELSELKMKINTNKGQQDELNKLNIIISKLDIQLAEWTTKYENELGQDIVNRKKESADKVLELTDI